MRNKNENIKAAIDILCVELMLHLSNVISDLNGTELKCYSWEFERISKWIESIRTLANEIKTKED